MKKSFLLVIMLFLFLFRHTSNAQWVKIAQLSGSNGSVMSLAGSGNNIYAGVGVFNNSSDGIYRSTSNGVSWTKVYNNYACDIAISGSSIFAAVDDWGIDSGVYRSTNNGTNWTKVLDKHVYRILISGTNIYVGGRGIYLSTSNGNNWTFIGNGINNQAIEALTVLGTYIFAGTKNYDGIFRTSNNGLNWTQVNNGLTSLFINDFAVIGTNLFVGTPQGVFRTTNYGNNWVSVNNGLNTYVWRLVASETNLFAASSVGDGIFLTKNYGANWIQKNQGFISTPAPCCFLIFNNNIFVGEEFDTEIWKRSYSEIIGIKKINSNIPEKFELFQNYPNPFNPSTKIRYKIPKNGFVKLIVYNILGREIEILVNEKQNAGTYEVTFDAKQFVSGIYFYKLKTEGFSETKKMMLLK